MRTLLVNYANEVFRTSQLLNTQTGLEVAGFQQALSFGPSDIDASFRRKNTSILSQALGSGLWLWKPYFIARALESVSDGDFVFYCDSGSYFRRPIAPLIEIAIETRQDIVAFDLWLFERDWTKRDAFIKMDCDNPRYSDTKQFLASFALFRKSQLTRNFVSEWLGFAEDEDILGNGANRCGQPNYPGFQEHRHDQSIFSLLAKRYEVPAHRDPSQWGNGSFLDYAKSAYGQLIEHTRARDAVQQI